MVKEEDKLLNFMNGFSAASELLQRAGKNGYFIESICLTASIIDGLLRIGLILNYQLETRTNKIIDSLLYQSKEDKIISERKIYRMALEKNIISESLFKELEDLYEQRNRVIHRYIISNISTKDVLYIGIRYEKVKYTVSNSIEKLENMQIKKRIGITHESKDTDEETKKALEKMASKKHNSVILSNILRKKQSNY